MKIQGLGINKNEVNKREVNKKEVGNANLHKQAKEENSVKERMPKTDSFTLSANAKAYLEKNGSGENEQTPEHGAVTLPTPDGIGSKPTTLTGLGEQILVLEKALAGSAIRLSHEVLEDLRNNKSNGTLLQKNDNLEFPLTQEEIDKIHGNELAETVEKEVLAQAQIRENSIETLTFCKAEGNTQMMMALLESNGEDNMRSLLGNELFDEFYGNLLNNSKSSEMSTEDKIRQAINQA